MAKPSEIMGMYVFSKRYAIRDHPTQQPQSGYTTVTHNNYIHYTCHIDAVRIDRERQ